MTLAALIIVAGPIKVKKNSIGALPIFSIGNFKKLLTIIWVKIQILVQFKKEH